MSEKSTPTPVTGSANQLGQNNLYFTSFEPKVASRFICYMKKKDDTILIPSYLIKEITRPSITRKDGKWNWNPIQIKAYDPIVPSAAQIFYEYIMENSYEKFDITVNVLDPVGNSVEKWEIKNAEIIDVDFGRLSWCSYTPDKKSAIHFCHSIQHYQGGEALEIKAVIKYEVAKLLY
jgi:hypothetical protein